MTTELNAALTILISTIVAIIAGWQANKPKDFYSAVKSFWKGLLPATLAFAAIGITRFSQIDTSWAAAIVFVLTYLINYYKNKDKKPQIS